MTERRATAVSTGQPNLSRSQLSLQVLERSRGSREPVPRQAQCDCPRRRGMDQPGPSTAPPHTSRGSPSRRNAARCAPELPSRSPVLETPAHSRAAAAARPPHDPARPPAAMGWALPAAKGHARPHLRPPWTPSLYQTPLVLPHGGLQVAAGQTRRPPQSPPGQRRPTPCAPAVGYPRSPSQLGPPAQTQHVKFMLELR